MVVSSTYDLCQLMPLLPGGTNHSPASVDSYIGYFKILEGCSAVLF